MIKKKADVQISFNKIVFDRTPKQMEWRAAFGLMITLIWLYIEVLELLAKVASRR